MKTFKIILLLTLAVSLFNCSDSNSPSNPEIRLVSETGSISISKAMLNKLDNEIQANTIDSIQIKKLRILISRVKLHNKEQDDTTDLGKEIKLTPTVFVIDSTGLSRTITTCPVPAGHYEKIKFEIHRFDSAELPTYANDALLKDFATAERYSVIIDGLKFSEGKSESFSYKSNVTANLSLKVTPYFDISEGNSITLALQIDPISIFKQGNSILDPADSKNANSFDNAIKTAIKALKK